MAELQNYNRVRFAQGTEAHYFKDGAMIADRAGVVYFATDSCKIYVDGIAYGIGGTVLETLKASNFVSGVSLGTDSNNNQQIVIEYVDSNGEAHTGENALKFSLFQVFGKDAITVAHKVLTTPKDGGEEGETTSTTTADYEVSLKINAGDNFLSQDGDGLKAEIGLSYSDNTLYLTGKGGENISAGISLGDLTKDRFLQSGNVVTIGEDDVEKSGLEVGTVALHLVLKTYEGDDLTDVYIATSDLVDVYTAGTGIELVEDKDDANGAGKKISVKLVSGGYLKADESGALDVDAESLVEDIAEDVVEAASEKILEEVKVGLVASDLKVSEDDERTLADAISTLDSSVDALETSVGTIESNIETIESDIDDIDSSIETIKGQITDIDSSITAVKGDISDIQDALEGIDSTTVLIGGETNISDNIKTENSIYEALKTLNDRIDLISGTGDEEGPNWNNEQISSILQTALIASGLNSETGAFDAAKYSDATALGKFAPAEGFKSISDVINALDDAVENLRVNHTAASWDEEGGYFNINIEFDDTDIAVNPAITPGALADAQNVHQALAIVNNSITWEFFKDEETSSDEPTE